MLESLSGNRNGFVNRRASFVGSSPTSSSILSCINVFTTPNKNEIKVNTTDIKSSFGKNSKLITTINNNLGDSHFIECIGNMRDIFNKYSAQMRMNMVNAVIDNINSLDGTKEQLRRMIDNSYFSEIEEEPCVRAGVNVLPPDMLAVRVPALIVALPESVEAL